MQLINFEKKRIVQRQGRNIVTYEVTCPRCNNVKYLRPSDAKRSEMCASCRNKKGYAEACRKYGKDFVIPFLRKYRLANPSQLERQVVSFLEQNNILFEREKIRYA